MFVLKTSRQLIRLLSFPSQSGLGISCRTQGLTRVAEWRSLRGDYGRRNVLVMGRCSRSCAAREK